MRTILVLIFLMISLLSYSATYYIDPAGSNSNDGSAERPWLTLSHACARVTRSGDIIHVNAGTYIEKYQSFLAKGVSIKGVGEASHIISHFVTTGATNGLISLETLTEGTKGDQSISYLKLDGDMKGTIAIYVLGRSNVKIHHCTIVNFTDSGVGFRGGYPTYLPSIFATDNEISNCTIRNSSSRTGFASHGLIRISGQSGMLIHDNILNQTDRSTGQNGNIIDAVEGYNKGLKFYNNKSYKPESEGTAWNFHIESWNALGGMEIYNNEFHGGGCHVDVAGKSNIKGTYDYSWWIHDNLFMLDAQVAKAPNEPYIVGISFEATAEDAIVSNNRFRNLPYGVYSTINQPDRHQFRISIHNNLFENMGYANNDWAFAIIICSYENLAIPAVIRDFHIYNNTITSGNPGRLTGGIHIQKAGSVSNVHIKNNIITNCTYPYYIYKGSGTITNIYTQYNLVFGNGNNNSMNNPEYISNYVNSNNLSTDPLFVSSSDFNLRPESPAINSGINVGLKYFGSAPDIGAFETQENEVHVNQLPVVTISSSIKGETYVAPFTLTIEVSASDPDGIITKVELFSGQKKVGEKTKAPFSFTLKDLEKGTYAFHAVATDNMNSTAISSVLNFEVKAEVILDENFSLYPNPNDGRFSIALPVQPEGESYTVRICDLMGNTVYQNKTLAEEFTHHVDLSHLIQGIYVVMISADRIIHTQKFIKS